MQLFRKIFISLALLLVSATNSMASTVTYKYVGNPFNAVSANGHADFVSSFTNITAFVTFDQAFLRGPADATNIVGGSISADGTNWYNLNDSSITASFEFVAGNISSWYLEAVQAGPSFVTQNDSEGMFDKATAYAGPGQISPFKSVTGNAGIWALQEQVNISPTPVPAAAWLLGSGLIGYAGLRRKNKTQLV